MSPHKPAAVLLVEDDENDVRITRRAIDSQPLPVTLQVAWDGEAALTALRAGPLPALILLDISLPKRDGFGVLAQLKADPRLAAVPVLMLTTSAQEEDVRRSYAAGASGYVVKPLRYPAFAALIARTLAWWLEDNRLPQPQAPRPAPEA